jgi:hypothetical protein
MQPQNDDQNYWQADSGSAEEQVSEVSQDSETLSLDVISWEASEYVDHHRDGAWFAGLIGVSLVLILVSVFVIKNYYFTLLIVVMTIAVVVYSQRPPRVMKYLLNEQGITIGQRFHAFEEFRSFGVIQDGAMYCVRLLPVGRFNQDATVYFAENDGEQIVDILGSVLPMENVQFDFVDHILRRLRL